MNRTWEIIGAPYDLSAYEKGASAAPAKIRHAYTEVWCERFRNKWGINIVDGGDVQTIDNEPIGEYLQRLRSRILSSYELDNTPVIIGGDHSISIATVSAASSVLATRTKKRDAPIGLLWFDAHADLNATSVGNLCGKPAAILLGHGREFIGDYAPYLPQIDPDGFHAIGVQDLMLSEYELIKRLGLHVDSIRAIDEHGIKTIVQSAVRSLEKNCEGFFVSIDIDVCASELFGACAAPMVGGLNARELCTAVEIASTSPKFMGIDIVEYCPEKDISGNTMNLISNVLHRLFGFTTRF